MRSLLSTAPLRRQIVLRCSERGDYEALKRGYSERFGMTEGGAEHIFSWVRSHDEITERVGDQMAAYLGMHIDILWPGEGA